jgi:hypothetical protein
MDDDDTAQHGQAAVGVVAVSRRSTYSRSIVTSVRPTEQVEGSRFVTNVWSRERSWTIIVHDTVLFLNSAPSHQKRR